MINNAIKTKGVHKGTTVRSKLNNYPCRQIVNKLIVSILLIMASDLILWC